MSAYWITTYKAVHDQEKVAAYAVLAAPALAAAGGRVLVRGGPEATCETGASEASSSSRVITCSAVSASMRLSVGPGRS